MYLYFFTLFVFSFYRALDQIKFEIGEGPKPAIITADENVIDLVTPSTVNRKADDSAMKKHASKRKLSTSSSKKE